MGAACQIYLILSPSGNMSAVLPDPFVVGWSHVTSFGQCIVNAPDQSVFDSDMRSPRTFFFLAWQLAMFEMVAIPSGMSPKCLRCAKVSC